MLKLANRYHNCVQCSCAWRWKFIYKNFVSKNISELKVKGGSRIYKPADDHPTDTITVYSVLVYDDENLLIRTLYKK